MSVQAPTASPHQGRAPVGLPASGPGRRVAAHAIDLAVVIAVGAAVYLPTASLLLGAVLGLELALGLAVWEARSGRTIGKHVLGIRAAQAGSDYAPGLARGLVRSLLLGASHGVALVGQFLLIATSALDRTGRGQAWHDRVAGTRVVNIRPDGHLHAPRARYAPGAQRQGPAAPPFGAHPHGPHPTAASAAGQPPAPGQPAPPLPAPRPGSYPQGPHATPASGQPVTPAPGPYAPPAAGPYAAGPQPAPAGSPAAPATGPAAPSTAGHASPPPAHPPAAGAGQPGTGQQAPGRSASPAATSRLPEHTFDPSTQPDPPPSHTLDPAAFDAVQEAREGAGGAVFVLTVDDGTSVTISGSGLIGRRPQPGPAEQLDHLVSVDDPGRSLSRTHAAFGIDGEELWVQDRGSANGTVVVAADGTTTRVHSGQRVAVPADGRIELGERAISVQRWQA